MINICDGDGQIKKHEIKEEKYRNLYFSSFIDTDLSQSEIQSKMFDEVLEFRPYYESYLSQDVFIKR